MAYCTQNDIELAISEDVLTQLTDDENAGSVDSDIVAAAIATADSEIDGYCAVKYTVPFTTVPAIVKALSLEIAIIISTSAARFRKD